MESKPNVCYLSYLNHTMRVSSKHFKTLNSIYFFNNFMRIVGSLTLFTDEKMKAQRGKAAC